ncbi:MAG: hypothetical protein VKL23_06250 [Cyanobacteriota bacterium]|nr:hypothetical protein [Cyanobacteriota bacterium]
MHFTDTDASARLLLQVLLLEMGLSADLAELDRRVAADPAFLQGIKRRALLYLNKQCR